MAYISRITGGTAFVQHFLTFIRIGAGVRPAQLPRSAGTTGTVLSKNQGRRNKKENNKEQ